MTRWERPRRAIVVYGDIALLIIGVIFRYRTGQALIWLGLRLRRFIPADLAHEMAVPVIRWTYWRPAVWKDR